MERLESVSRIPTAIDAIVECLDRAMEGRGTKDRKVMSELGKVADEVTTIREAMIQFSFVPVDITPWKHAHHCTNQIWHTEMAVLFKTSRPAVVKLLRNNPEKIAFELDKVNNLKSSRSHILAQDRLALDLDLPVNLQELLNRDSVRRKHSWDSFILFSIEHLQQCFDGGEEEMFCKTLDDYRVFVQGLNQASDNRLLSGLGKLGDKLDEMRGRLMVKAP
ncbi:hypothetical protein [Rhizobium sp. BR 249]|uniref:hypothetical protein n=1 Tax=Rhizobium sp. BR 249 TaxID=3040011 RepID=UPI0039BF7387